MKRNTPAAVSVLIAACLASLARGEAAPDIAADPAASRGVVIHVGVTDGALDAALATPGTAIVHALAFDDASAAAARAALRTKNLYGVATVSRFATPGRLPYPDHFASLVVVDADALRTASITAAEANRVLAPSGVLYIHADGKWTKTTKPMPKEMAEWPHPNGTMQNNPVSKDALVKPVTTVKWIDSYARFGYGMSQAGIPVAGAGVFAHDMQWASSQEGKKFVQHRFVVRDAFSGVVRWQVPVQETTRFQMIAGGKAFTSLRPPKESAGLYAYDLATGKLITKLEIPEVKGRAPEVNAVADASTLYMAAGPELKAFTLSDLKPRWTYKTDADTIFSPGLSEDAKSIVLVENAGTRFGARWPSASVASITCLDTATGNVLWKNTDVKGSITSYMPIANGKVFYYATWGIIAQTWEHKTPQEKATNPRYFGVIDLASGKRVWQKDWKDADGTGDLWVQVGFVREDLAWLSQPDWTMAFDLSTGERKANIRTSVVNQRCIRTKATDNYNLMGFGTFLTKDGKYTDQNVSRSACAVGSTPAYGTVYQTADGCGCFAQLRGFAGFAAEAPLAELPSEKRLDKSAPPVEPAGQAVAALKPADTVTSTVGKHAGDELFTVRIPVITSQPVRDSWINTETIPYPETASVKSPAGELVAVVNEHRLECRSAGKVVWSATADARITGEPLVHNSRVYFAAHDGYVYCLDAATGKRQWRYLVAPAIRYMSAYGQLESAWPIRNVVLHNGLICAAAGRHPELDGGIYLAGLDAATGAAKWTGRIRHDTANEWFSIADKKRSNKNLNWITNGGLKIDDGKLLLIGLDKAHGGGNKMPKLDPYPIDPSNPPK